MLTPATCQELSTVVVNVSSEEIPAAFEAKVSSAPIPPVPDKSIAPHDGALLAP